MSSTVSLKDYNDGRPLAGSFVTVADPVIAEVMGEAGFDFLIVDVEHTGMPLLSVQTLLQAIGNTRAAPLVRVGELSEMQIKQALDAGADGVIVPHIKSAEDAARLVQYSKYPPMGTRGLTAARAARYGNNFDEYSKTANSRTSVVALIEDIEAVAEAEAIASTEGIDFVFIGPWDLSATMGHMGNPGAPEVEEAVQSIIDAVKSSGKRSLIYAESGAGAKYWITRGIDGIVLGEDYQLLLEQCRAQLTAMGR